MKYALIVNPVAGSGHAKEVAVELEKLLQERKTDYSIHYSEHRGHTTQLAEALGNEPDVDAILCVGGDGTAFDAATGVLAHGKPLGIIPAGTGNDFIKTLGLPKDPVEALKFILDHDPKPTDVGRVNERIFLNVAGTGFDVTVLDFAEEQKKRFKGMTPYMIGLLKAIRHYKPVHMKITVDGEVVEKELLICSIANGRYFGGGIPICPDADAADGKLDVVMIDSVPRWKIPFYLPGLVTGKDLKWKYTRRVKAENVIMESTDMRFNTDGEINPMDRAEITMLPGAMMMYRV